MTKIINWLKKWEILPILQTVAILAGSISIIVGLMAFNHEQKKDSADLVLKFMDYFNQPRYQELMESLDTNNKELKIFQPEGNFSETIVGDYLGVYETIDDLYKNKLIDCNMIYQNFSFNLEAAYKNSDIQKMVASDQQYDPGLWTGFKSLGKQFNNKNPCKI